MGEPLLVGVREAARVLGVGVGSTYGLIREGRLPHLRVGKRILVPRTALVAWVEAESRRAEA